jgi:hypothetical protein
MGILAAAAFVFYFRRKYQMAERGWQRITAADSASLESPSRSSLQR